MEERGGEGIERVEEGRGGDADRVDTEGEGMGREEPDGVGDIVDFIDDDVFVLVMDGMEVTISSEVH